MDETATALAVQYVDDALMTHCSPRFSPEDMELLAHAIDFAKKAHAGQKRESGEPYYVHPEAVAMMLYDMGMDAHTVIAGLLHDVVEDCATSVDMLRDLFGEDIAGMVDGVTKLTKTSNRELSAKEDQEADNLRKMFLAIAKDVRVVIIKLTDRLHNMRTLGYCSEAKRVRKAKETLDVYAPLAHRFGMGAMKCELEDLCFSFIWPDEYKKLQAELEPSQSAHMETLNNAMQVIRDNLDKAHIKAQINGRPKHLYSIYKKAVRQNKSLNEIYDLIAVRVVVETINDCYAALGIIHSLWKPMPGRFKDYIAMPKTNMYRSLHTTLFSKEGMPFEVQIRTFEMHRTAEYGIAAHWMYKEGRSSQDEMDSKMAWLREALELENYSESTLEFVDSVRKDFFSDYVYVLTPQGKIIDLVTGSTPLDFAYRIHTNVGHHARAARVNGALVKLDYKLKTNDVVEILTNPQAAPSRDWLKLVKTQQAKAKIRQWFKKANREENIQRGKEMLADAAKRQGRNLSELTKDEYFADIIKRFNMSEMDDVYACIGYGGITTGQVLHRLIEQYRKEERTAALQARLAAQDQAVHNITTTHDCGIIVRGEPNMVVRFAQCCTPLPGDPIIGYITRGRGVSVHRADCPNVKDLLLDDDRIIEVEWAQNIRASYTVSIQIAGTERAGLLMDISQVLSSMNISIKSMNAKTDTDANMVTVRMSFDVNNAEQLSSIVKNLRKVKGIADVFRINV
ncbi:MAG: bifunctional (p)ppGpp synthetase/guanosine-3',5'-bis(diphosphate) 3'-pyrophosphohydrolase [Eubacteriales bacterium]|nr:bifunctional (p)ppGpp synthetase/guanosine-3',5'-bis(diphosphate) 3'-pyrophosphohydrolase [Eubacteriales bacterium]